MRRSGTAAAAGAHAVPGLFGDDEQDEYEMTLEPASRSMEFSPRRRMTMRRKTDG